MFCSNSVVVNIVIIVEFCVVLSDSFGRQVGVYHSMMFLSTIHVEEPNLEDCCILKVKCGRTVVTVGVHATSKSVSAILAFVNYCARLKPCVKRTACCVFYDKQQRKKQHNMTNNNTHDNIQHKVEHKASQ